MKGVQDHAEFYQAAKRRESLKRYLKADDTPGMIRLKMLAVCASSEPRMDNVLENPPGSWTGHVPAL